MSGTQMTGVRNYAVVTASYWGFTLTDGALRMLVLLHFYSLGYTPFMLSFLFLLYEAAGIFANLGGGWLAARFGIPRMLMTGLALQITGLMLLSALNPGWSAALSVTWVVAAQGQGPHQDGLKIRDQGHFRRRFGPALQMGRLVHRLQERDEGFRIFLRRPAA